MAQIKAPLRNDGGSGYSDDELAQGYKSLSQQGAKDPGSHYSDRTAGQQARGYPPGEADAPTQDEFIEDSKQA